jgi:hypothetical protein
MLMEHCWNDTDRGKPKYSEKTLSHCYFVHHKFHTQWPATEPRTLEVKGQQLPKPIVTKNSVKQ